MEYISFLVGEMGVEPTTLECATFTDLLLSQNNGADERT